MIKKLLLLIPITFFGCIGEDVDPSPPNLDIMNVVDELKVLQSHQFDYSFSIAFEQDPDAITWESSDATILTISSEGFATAQAMDGQVTLTATASFGEAISVSDEMIVDVSYFDPSIRITNPVVSLEEFTTHQLAYVYTNRLSAQSTPSVVNWSSSDESIATVTDGLLSGLARGSADISVETNQDGTLSTDSFTVLVDETTVMETSTRYGELASNSEYDFQGKFEMSMNESNRLILAFDENYLADDTAPDLYIYLSNNPTSISEAFEVDEVSTFSGDHSYIIDGVGVLDYNYVVFADKTAGMVLGSGEAGDEPVTEPDRFGIALTTSSYDLYGEFLLKKDGSGVILEFADNYEADRGLPDLVVYLSNNPNSFASALEIEEVSIYTGAHSYSIDNVTLDDYQYVLYFCRRFNQKVGHGEILEEE